MSTGKQFWSFAALFLVVFVTIPLIVADDSPIKPAADATKSPPVVEDSEENQPPPRLSKTGSAPESSPPEFNKPPEFTTPPAEKAQSDREPSERDMPPAIAEMLRIRKSQGSVLKGSILDDGGEGPSFSDALRQASKQVPPVYSPGKSLEDRQPTAEFTRPSMQRFPSSQPPQLGQQPRATRPLRANPVTQPEQFLPHPPTPAYPQVPRTAIAPPAVAPAPAHTPAPTPWQNSPQSVPPNSPYYQPSVASGPDLIQSLRVSARLLEKRAHLLEAAKQDKEADRYYALAHKIRKQIRFMQSEAGPPVSPYPTTPTPYPAVSRQPKSPQPVAPLPANLPTY